MTKKPKNKKGAVAFRTLLRYLNNGTCGFINADIPPGPKFEFGRGIIAIARLSQKTDYAHSHPDTERSLYQKIMGPIYISQAFWQIGYRL